MPLPNSMNSGFGVELSKQGDHAQDPTRIWRQICLFYFWCECRRRIEIKRQRHILRLGAGIVLLLMIVVKRAQRSCGCFGGFRGLHVAPYFPPYSQTQWVGVCKFSVVAAGIDCSQDGKQALAAIESYRVLGW